MIKSIYVLFRSSNIGGFYQLRKLSEMLKEFTCCRPAKGGW